MSTSEEHLADAYNEGYDEDRTTCQECIVEFQRGLQWGLTIARVRLLEAESLQMWTEFWGSVLPDKGAVSNE